MKILIATGNPHKFKELSAILPKKQNSGEKIEYVSLADFKGLNLPPETGSTLEENAAIKAVYAAKQTGLPAVADDTGLEVAPLDGRPGVHTARYAGDHADTDENNRKLLAELDGLLLHQRKATFHTVACLALPTGQHLTFDGRLDGYIGFGYRGENGFGYDPLFIVKDTTQTLAELTDKEKNAISHRAKAFGQLSEKLKILK